MLFLETIFYMLLVLGVFCVFKKTRYLLFYSLSFKDVSWIRFVLIFCLFSVLVVWGYAEFGFDVYSDTKRAHSLANFGASDNYNLYIRFLPKLIIIAYLLYYYLMRKEIIDLKIKERIWFFVWTFPVMFTALISACFFLKEKIGYISILSVVKNPQDVDISNIIAFYLHSIPAILLVTYFQFVNAKYIAAVFKNTFKKKEKEND